MQVAKSVNANITFEYLMAGHDLALIKSQEKAEDDVVQAITDLKAIGDDDENCTLVLYIGITCGMSAPYVGAQLDWIMNSPHPARISYIPVLMAFNPTSMARTTPIEGFPKTMMEVVTQLQQRTSDGRHFILNPIIGPEPVAGSSRMKGGSITKILLEMIAAKILHEAFPTQLPLFPFASSDTTSSPTSLPAHSSFMALVDQYERVNRWTYEAEAELAQAVQMAGDALKAGGHVYYLGEDSIAIIALIDASECPPTYGAEFSDFRCFVPGGWATMQNLEGDMSQHADYYQISDSYFEEHIIPTLTQNDVICTFLESSQSSTRLLHLLQASCSRAPGIGVVMINWEHNAHVQESMREKLNLLPSSSPTTPEQPISLSSQENKLALHRVYVPVRLPVTRLLPGLMSPVEISAKWILNAISTGAHILKGKVWSNRMIDLKLSNDKLFRRALTLLQQLLPKVSEKEALHSLLMAIHRTNVLSDATLSMPISQHIEQAQQSSRVLPVAILLASKRAGSIEEANDALSREPILRNLIADIVQT